MKQQNILGLLKDCKENTQFYSRECGKVVFSHIEDNSIVTYTEAGDSRVYNSKGYDVEADSTAEPMFFPSKDVQDWSFYKVKYIKVNNQAEAVKAIEYFEQEGYIKNMYITYLAAGGVVYIDAITHEINTHSVNYRPYCYDYILSTGTELKLEEKPHKFKVGDVIGKCKPMIVAEELNIPDEYWITPEDANRPLYDYSYTPPETIAKWNKEVLEPNHLHYSMSKRKIIHWFLPFDKVVVREAERKWHADLFSEYDIDNDNDCEMCYLTLGGSPWDECLPYNAKTAKLIGTTEDYEE